MQIRKVIKKFENFNDIKEQDVIEAYEMVEVKR